MGDREIRITVFLHGDPCHRDMPDAFNTLKLAGFDVVSVPVSGALPEACPRDGGSYRGLDKIVGFAGDYTIANSGIPV